MKKLLHSSSRKKPSESPEEEKKPPLSGYARYSNIVYLLIGSMAVAVGAGYLLDRIFQLSFPVFKLVFSFGGVLLALYLVFKELNRK